LLLEHSIKMLPYDEPSWITMGEASSLFSPQEDQYAFGEMDEVGKQNLAGFASGVGDRCLFEFMPVERRDSAVPFGPALERRDSTEARTGSARRLLASAREGRPALREPPLQPAF
jgi:hypothetical protein